MTDGEERTALLPITMPRTGRVPVARAHRPRDADSLRSPDDRYASRLAVA
jgi:hypothetical protein